MALRLTRAGGVSVVEKRTLMREPERLRDRDREFFMKRLEGWSVVEIGNSYGLTRQYVNRRLAAIPKALRREYLDDYRDTREKRMLRFEKRMDALYARSG